MTAYYNEFDPKAAAWLRELIAEGHIAPGDVDERSIEDVTPTDLLGYTQCHFFAGIGGWSYALRNAGWADSRPVWTGSCPCQPFSAAGKRGGTDDERHLWPAFYHLIEQCRPPVIFGEQVASKDGLGWFDLVSADLEGSGYACGAVDLCAAGVGAPHIRQRLWWVGERLEHASGDGRIERRAEPGERGATGGRGLGRVADTIGERGCGREPRSENAADAGLAGEAMRVADSAVLGRLGRGPSETGAEPGAVERPDGLCDVGVGAGRPGPTNGFWRDADWLGCRDGKWRPVEPGTFPLAHGAPARVGRLRGYGNAIAAPAAQAFIEAYLDTLDLRLMSVLTPDEGDIFS